MNQRELKNFRIELFGQVAEAGEPLRFESRLSSLDRWFDVYVSRLGDGGNRQVAVVFNDVTARKRSEEALRISESQQAFLLELNDRVRRLADPNEIRFAAARALGEYLQASRVGYAEADESGETVVVTGNYTDGAALVARHAIGGPLGLGSR